MEESTYKCGSNSIWEFDSDDSDAGGYDGSSTDCLRNPNYEGHDNKQCCAFNEMQKPGKEILLIKKASHGCILVACEIPKRNRHESSQYHPEMKDSDWS